MSEPIKEAVNQVARNPVETIVVALATFMFCTAVQEIAANFGYDWRAYLPRPRAAATPPAATGGA